MGAARDGHPSDILPGRERQHVLFKPSEDMMPFRPDLPKTRNFRNTHTPSSGQACREQLLFADNRRADSCHCAGGCGHNSSLPSTATQSSDCYSAHFTGEEREARNQAAYPRTHGAGTADPPPLPAMTHSKPMFHDAFPTHFLFCIFCQYLKKNCFGLAAQHIGSQFPDQVDQTCAPSSGSVES